MARTGSHRGCLSTDLVRARIDTGGCRGGGGGDSGGTTRANHCSHYPACLLIPGISSNRNKGDETIRDLRRGKHCLSPAAAGNCACCTLYGDIRKGVCLQDSLAVCVKERRRKKKRTGKGDILAICAVLAQKHEHNKIV